MAPQESTNGTALFPLDRPDIQVSVKPDDERSYFADPFKEIAATPGLIASLVGEVATNMLNGTNRPVRQHQINEAELMRERHEKPGVDVEDLVPSDLPVTADAEKPIIRDPVLGRAVRAHSC